MEADHTGVMPDLWPAQSGRHRKRQRTARPEQRGVTRRPIGPGRALRYLLSGSLRTLIVTRVAGEVSPVQISGPRRASAGHGESVQQASCGDPARRAGMNWPHRPVDGRAATTRASAHRCGPYGAKDRRLAGCITEPTHTRRDDIRCAAFGVQVVAPSAASRCGSSSCPATSRGS
jgi:hypothetical protein